MRGSIVKGDAIIRLLFLATVPCIIRTALSELVNKFFVLIVRVSEIMRFRGLVRTGACGYLGVEFSAGRLTMRRTAAVRMGIIFDYKPGDIGQL